VRANPAPLKQGPGDQHATKHRQLPSQGFLRFCRVFVSSWARSACAVDGLRFWCSMSMWLTRWPVLRDRKASNQALRCADRWGSLDPVSGRGGLSQVSGTGEPPAGGAHLGIRHWPRGIKGQGGRPSSNCFACVARSRRPTLATTSNELMSDRWLLCHPGPTTRTGLRRPSA